MQQSEVCSTQRSWLINQQRRTRQSSEHDPQPWLCFRTLGEPHGLLTTAAMQAQRQTGIPTDFLLLANPQGSLVTPPAPL